MRSSIAVAIAAAGIASAQIAAIPGCAISCFVAAVGTSGCGASDYACQCSTGQAAIAKSSIPCLCKACSAEDQLKAHDATDNICISAYSAMGKSYTNTALTINACDIATGHATTTIVSGAGGGANSAATTTSPSTTTSTGASTTSTGTSAVVMSSGGSSVTSAMSSMTSAMSSMTSGGSSMTSAASSTSSAGSSSAVSAASSAASSATTPNAAPMVTVAAELMVGGIAAAAGYFAI